MAKTLNTRIVLRNDSTANWNASKSEVLMEGEMGLEFLENGKVKIKVGDNSTPWEQLPYVGADEAQVFQVEPQEGESDDAAITRVIGASEIHAGDMAIVKRTFATKVSHTAYVYDGVWKAMDGNYNANNVYFESDLQTTAPIGNVSLVNGQAKISAAGKNLNEVWQQIFVKEKDPTITQPSASISKTGGIKYFEIGTEGSSNVSLKLDDGKYEYGFDRNGQVVNDGTTGVSATAYHVSYDGKEVLSSQSGVVNSGKKNTAIAMSATGSIDHSAGQIPVSNTGNKRDNLKINSGSKSAGSIELFRWYIPMFAGFKFSDSIIADPAKITNAEVKALSKITDETAYNKTVPTSATASKAWRQYFIAVPSDYKRNIIGAKDSNNLTQTVVKANDVTIDINGNSVLYNVWFINNAADYDTLSISMDWN